MTQNALIEKPVEYVTPAGEPIKLTMAMVRKYGVSGKSELVTDNELVYYMNLCKTRKLNPFIKDCYLVKYDTAPAAIITSIDYFRKNARRAKDCRGWKKGVIVIDKEGKIYKTAGLAPEDTKIIGGWFKAKPAGWDEAFELEVNLESYIKKRRDGTPTQFWTKEKQATMIAKVAEAQGLKSLWGENSSGMYTADEIPPPAEDTLGTPPADLPPYSPPQPAAAEAASAQEPRANPADNDFTAKTFETYIAGSGDPLMDKFLEVCALHGGKSVLEVKSEACQKKAEFENAFQRWKAKQIQPADGNSKTYFRSEWIKLRPPGFADFVWKNINRFRTADPKLQDEAAEKWTRFYDEPCPFKEPPQTPSNAPDEVRAQNGTKDIPADDNTPPVKNTIVSHDEYEALIHSAEWQELSMLQSKHPEIYKQVVGYQMPATIAETSAAIDAIEARIGGPGGMPGA